LVLAGEQSCGKSSLLESLTNFPVPISTGHGTRFPIEIMMVKDPDKYQIKSRIIPYGTFPESRQKKLDKFNSMEPMTKSMNRSDFMKLLREVRKSHSLNITVEAGITTLQLAYD
jgi:GTPase SAR1 family protein